MYVTAYAQEMIMIINVDLHSHSGASGGVGVISLEQTAETMHYKGIDVFGTGDAFHAGWQNTLGEKLKDNKNGLYSLKGSQYNARFLIQSEVIITAPVPSGGRKNVHTVVLMPSLEVAGKVSALLGKFGVKLNIGRPFLTCENKDEVADRLSQITAIDDMIEIIPAHVLTPQGIYGSNNPVDSMACFFGDFAKNIHAIETGLSADPEVLALIPELDNIAMISSSDCHCGALNRVGREYTSLKTDNISYEEIINAIRKRNIEKTAEFSPAEGRFFLTGHRSGKKPHTEEEFCYFSPDTVPANDLCPICGKKLTVGVLQRALELSEIQGNARKIGEHKPKQKYFHMVPLVEIIAAGLSTKNPNSKKVTGIYYKIIEKCENEAIFWDMDEKTINTTLNDFIPQEVITAIGQIKAGDYTFSPLGYDGTYGNLALGEKADWFGQKNITGAVKAGSDSQSSLF